MEVCGDQTTATRNQIFCCMSWEGAKQESMRFPAYICGSFGSTNLVRINTQQNITAFIPRISQYVLSAQLRVVYFCWLARVFKSIKFTSSLFPVLWVAERGNVISVLFVQILKGIFNAAVIFLPNNIPRMLSLMCTSWRLLKIPPSQERMS